jgi:hypothetical protein
LGSGLACFSVWYGGGVDGRWLETTTVKSFKPNGRFAAHRQF